MNAHSEMGFGTMSIHSGHHKDAEGALAMPIYQTSTFCFGGYPEGLAGEAIPLAAQIVSIVQAYCALTDKKHYSREEAFRILEGEAGIKFNPDIFRICRKISRQLC